LCGYAPETQAPDRRVMRERERALYNIARAECCADPQCRKIKNPCRKQNRPPPLQN
jgi:hypothetical protein